MMRAGWSDAGFFGDRFTWSNNRHEEGVIWETLDRFLVNGRFLEKVAKPKIYHLTRA